MSKGIPRSEEVRKKISQSHIGIGKGKIPWNKGRKETRKEVLEKQSNSHKGQVSAMKGKIHSPETRMKISLATKGRKLTIEALKNHKGFSKGYTPWNIGIPSWNRGKKGGTAWNKGIKGFMAAEKHWHWKGGITPTNAALRNTLEYKLWRTSVFHRDNYTCIWCGARNGNGKRIVLHADHIKPWALSPELRLAIDNGRTLCIDCHKKTDSYGGNYFKHYGK